MNGRIRVAYVRWVRSRCDERGSMAVEMLLVVPLLMALVLLVVAAGDYVSARSQVSDSAYDAARAAVIDNNFTAAQADGTAAARSSLANRGVSCVSMDVSFAGTNFQPGGTVQVKVTCAADLSSVAGFGVPGHHTFTATAVVPIEQWRNIAGAP